MLDHRRTLHRRPPVLSEGRLYVIAVLENHSRAILSSTVTRSQDLSAYLSVLYRAVERYGSPETFVTDSGSIFLANRAKAIYGALGLAKHEIERGRPWQSYVETAFNVQRRMADWHFARAESRGRSSCATVSWRTTTTRSTSPTSSVKTTGAHRWKSSGHGSALSARRPREGILLYALLESPRRPRLRTLPALAGVRRGKPRKEGSRAVASGENTHPEACGRGAISLPRGVCERHYGPQELSRPELFEISHVLPRLRLFRLGLDERGWLKALKPDGYCPRSSYRPLALQQELFTYAKAL